MATDGIRELITVVETISGDGMALSPLVIYKGAAHYMVWYQHLDSLIAICKSWKFTYSKSGWNNSFLPEMEKSTSPPPVPPTPRNSATMLRKARQAKLLLQRRGQNINREELVGLIDSLERFAIGTDKDLQLERGIHKKW